jgi:hypothetical protein
MEFVKILMPEYLKKFIFFLKNKNKHISILEILIGFNGKILNDG